MRLQLSPQINLIVIKIDNLLEVVRCEHELGFHGDALETLKTVKELAKAKSKNFNVCFKYIEIANIEVELGLKGESSETLDVVGRIVNELNDDSLLVHIYVKISEFKSEQGQAENAKVTLARAFEKAITLSSLGYKVELLFECDCNQLKNSKF